MNILYFFSFKLNFKEKFIAQLSKIAMFYENIYFVLINNSTHQSFGAINH